MQLNLQKNICAFWSSEIKPRFLNYQLLNSSDWTQELCLEDVICHCFSKCWETEGVEVPPEVLSRGTVSHLSRPVSKALQKQLPKGHLWIDTEDVSVCVMFRAIDGRGPTLPVKEVLSHGRKGAMACSPLLPPV